MEKKKLGIAIIGAGAVAGIHIAMPIKAPVTSAKSGRSAICLWTKPRR